MSDNRPGEPSMSLEARIWVMQRDIENLKMRDTEIRAFQDKMNAAFYKLDGLEKILEDHKERLDETSDLFKEATRDIFKKIDDAFPKESSKKSDKTELINTIAKIIFALITIIGTSLLGIKSLGGGG